jgi:predicted metalloprotease
VALAHEFGHAVLAHLAKPPRRAGESFQRLSGYQEEKMADCMAGVMTRKALETGTIPDGSYQEAEDTIVAMGSSIGRNPGLRPFSHPNWRIRRDQFLRGFNRGVAGCTIAALSR